MCLGLSYHADEDGMFVSYQKLGLSFFTSKSELNATCHLQVFLDYTHQEKLEFYHSKLPIPEYAYLGLQP